ncbi:MAG: gliding motility lipoprotein GldH [Spirosomataceae bacterium]
MKNALIKSVSFFFTSFFICSFLMSCEVDGVYKGKKDFPELGWRVRDIPTFTFKVERPEEPLNYYYIVRNDVDYAYYNLFIKYTLLDSSGRVIRAKMEEITLFDPKTGKPFGKGLGDIFDHQIKATSLQNFRFPAPGNYTIKIEQYMRQDPLAGIMTMGLTIEKPETPKL